MKSARAVYSSVGIQIQGNDTPFLMNPISMSSMDIIIKAVSESLYLTSLHVYLFSQHDQYNHLWVSRSRAMKHPSSSTPVPSPKSASSAAAPVGPSVTS